MVICYIVPLLVYRIKKNLAALPSDPLDSFSFGSFGGTFLPTEIKSFCEIDLWQEK
jgi:hypothetical protein